MSCPANLPPPAGYQILRGAVPTPLTQWAIDLLHHVNRFQYGQTWSIPYNGRVIIARKDCHSWTYRGGQLITGLSIPGITLYEPIASPTGAGALAVGDLTTPDPTAAVYSEAGPNAPNWGLVLASAGAAAGVVFMFKLALEYAGER